MPVYFLDTSALVKHYHPEPGTARVDAIWADTTAELWITRLGSVELLSALAAKVRAGGLTPIQFQPVRRRFLADVIRRRRPRMIRLIRSHYAEAESLLGTYGLAHRLRANDSLQLAAALHLKRKAALDLFVCSDKDLLAAATNAGLVCIDPESP